MLVLQDWASEAMLQITGTLQVFRAVDIGDFENVKMRRESTKMATKIEKSREEVEKNVVLCKRKQALVVGLTVYSKTWRRQSVPRCISNTRNNRMA